MIDRSAKLANRVVDYIKSSLPITSENGMQLTIDNLKVNIPESNYDIDHQLQMKYSGSGSTEGTVSGTVKIKDQAGRPVYSGHYASLIKFPVATERGTYIVNGVERNIISQMRMKPGCYTNSSDNGIIKTQLRFERNKRAGAYMPAMTLVFDTTTKKFTMDIKSFSKNIEFNILNFLALLGYQDMEIMQALGGNGPIADAIYNANAKSRNRRTMDDLFKIFYPKAIDGQNLSDAQKREKIFQFFNENASFGAGDVIESTLGLTSNNKVLTKDVITKAIKKTASVAAGLVKEDVKDEIEYKEVYNDSDLIFDAIATGIDNFFDNAVSKMASYNASSQAVNIMTDVAKTIQAPLNGKDGLMQSELCIASEEINPLFMEAKQREISQGGPNGMSKDSMRNETDARNLTTSGMNKIDPIETPESGKIGFTQHLTVGAIIEGSTIKSEFFKVVNGKAEAGNLNAIKLSPLEEKNAIVAFNDSRYVRQEGNKIVFTQDTVPARYMGKRDNYPVSKIQYIDAKPQSVLGTSANMIPFVSNDDGARALMGAAMQKQAVNLIARQAPMVTTLADKHTGMTFDEKVGNDYGKPVKSLATGTVQSIDKSKIIVLGNDGKTYQHSYYNYYPLNQSYINNELKVKVGDRVQEGQILAEGWQTDGGKLALGRNAKIGFLPFKGYNYEDGVVISESFAKAMTADEYNEVEINIPKTALGGRGSNVKKELTSRTTDASLNDFDNDGIVKVGTKIKAGSVLVGLLLETKDSDDIVDLIMKGNKIDYKYSGKSVPAGSYVSGTVERITVINNPDAVNKQKIIFSIVKQQPLKLGDKIAGRHGNKGTITKILPDDKMPVAEDGSRLDLMMSPLAVPSRKNPGQLLEVGAGLIAEKEGKPFVVDNFNHNEKERVLQKLKEIGYPDGKMKVTLKEEDENGNIIDVPVENPVTVGNMYIMKLKHKVDDKIQARSNVETSVTRKTHMPQKIVGTAAGEKSNPQRLGEMEMRALQAHGATWNILESSTIKADGAGNELGKAAIFKAIATGKLDSSELSKSATPETVKVFADNLKVLGLDVKPMYNGVEVSLDKPFNSLGLAPMNQREFLNTIGHDKEVFKVQALQSRQLYGDKDSKTSQKDKTAPEVKNGLIDTDIFGNGEEEDRNKWGYIKLPIPTPNPLFMEDSSNNIYEHITGLKKDELKRLTGVSQKTKGDGSPLLLVGNVNEIQFPPEMSEAPDLIQTYKNDALEYMSKNNIKEGSLISATEVDKLRAEGIMIPCSAGGLALEKILKKVDVNAGLEKAKAELEAAKGKEIDKAYKKVKAFEMLQANNLKADDLLVKCLPVAPTYLRPIIPKVEDRGVLVNDLNKLYEKVIFSKQTAEKEAVLDSNGNITDQSGLSPLDISQRSKQLYDSLKMMQGKLDAKDKGKTLSSVVDNIGGKPGIVRKEMLAKRVDFSGRSVITVNPNLTLDEIGLPLDMAKSLYKPFILKELVDRGICANEKEARNRLEKADKEVKSVIQAIANDRPIFVNRQPSLHKYSIQAMKPVIKEYEDGGVVRSIQLNPLVVTGFNADFDGDTMAVHVPITEKAKEEAKKLTMPSQNLINPTDGKMIIEIRHEMALGIYQLTRGWDKPQGKTMQFSMLKDLQRAYLLGQIPYNQKVKIPIYVTETTAGQAMFNWLIPEKIKQHRNFRQIWDKSKISKMLEAVYKEAEANDFKVMSKVEIAQLFDSIKDLGFKASTRTGVSLGVGDFTFKPEIQKTINTIVNKGIEAGGGIEAWKKVEDEIEDKLKKGLLPEDNALQVMMSSGARASAQQIRKMFATIGVGMDVSKNILDPIHNSHFDGLSPQDFYNLGKDSRKGMYDRSVSTEKPGALTRDVWSAVQDVVISEADCHTKDFINIKKNDSTIKGRFAGKDILDAQGKVICKHNQIIDNSIYDKIYKDDTIEYVAVRSPLRCKTVSGKCQKCYGAMPGTMQLPKIGTAIGVIASQAIGEPVTQMTMNTFHTGGANSQATLGLPRIESILNLSNKPDNKAVLAEQSGAVTDIIETPDSITIIIGKKRHIIKKTLNNLSPTIKVKKGDIVNKGDFLTAGDTSDISVVMDDNKTTMVLTNADPKKMFALKAQALGQDEALNQTRDYLSTSMQYAIKASNTYMDRRHTETIVSKLTSQAIVIDSGDSPYMKGQKADVNLFEKWNKDNCTGTRSKSINPINAHELNGRILAMDIDGGGKTIFKKGQIITPDMIPLLSKYPSEIKVCLRPIQYESRIDGQSSASITGNWFSDMGSTGHGGIMKRLSSGAMTGSVDPLVDPRARLMAGKMLNIGEATDLKDEFKDKFPSRMSNFFNSKIDVNKYRK